MARDAFKAQTQAAKALGGVGPTSRGRRGRRKKRATKSDFKAMGFGSTPSGASDLPEITQRALGGEYGASSAKRAYEALMGGDLSDAAKKQITEFYEGKSTDSGSSKNLLHHLTHNPVTDVIGTGLMLIDKPKRAVQATIEEGVEAATGNEDGRSWADNVLREADYGWGDVMQRLKDAQVAKAKANGDSDPDTPGWSESKWGMRGIGLLGDLLLDPLTYVGAGVVSKGAKATKATSKGAKAAEASFKLKPEAVARRLADKGLIDEAAEVLKRGTVGASADALEQVGAQGGLRFAGRQVLDHDTYRALMRPVGASRRWAGDSKLMRALQTRVGADELADLRLAMRDRTAAPLEAVNALRAKDAFRAASKVKNKFGAAHATKLGELMDAAKLAKVPSHTLRAAVTGDAAAEAMVEAATRPGFVSEVRQWFSDVRMDANRLAPDDFELIADAGRDYAPNYLTDEAAAYLAKRSPKGSGGVKRSFEHRAHKAGDAFGDEVLGDPALHARLGLDPNLAPDSREAIGLQMEGLMREWGFKGDLFTRDAYADWERYLRGVTNRVGEVVRADELAARGVATEAKKVPTKAAKRLAELQAIAASSTSATKLARSGGDALVPILDDKIDDILDAAKTAKGEARAKLAERGRLVLKQKATLGRLATETDPQARMVLALDYKADELAVMLMESGRPAMTWDEFGRAMRTEAGQRQFRYVIEGGFQSMADFGLAGMQLPDWHFDALVRAADAHADPTKVGEWFDQATRYLKTYQIMSPGFHVRNGMGAIFNNFVAGVDPSSYGVVSKAMHQYRKGGLDAITNPQAKAAFKQMDEAGFVLGEGAQLSAEMATGTARSSRNIQALNRIGLPVEGVLDNTATRFTRKVGDRVEETHRATLAYDVLAKGGTLDEAMDRVYQFHFDYSDLSSFESQWMRRIVPFWTWTSRNMPLQMEMIYKEPRMYQRFRAAQAAASSDEDWPELTPSWLRDTSTATHLGGGNVLTLDMPWQDVDDQTHSIGTRGPFSVLQSANPIIKTPLETIYGKQTFSGAPLTDQRTPMPRSWQLVPGLVPLLRGAGWLTDKDPETGQYLISNKNAYIIEQGMPLLGRTRRLFPSEKRFQERALASWATFMGIGARQITDSDKRNETFRIAEALEARRDREREAGRVKPSSGR